MKNVKIVKMFPLALIFIGFILILDQLYLFGIPFGPFLGDLSRFDPTQDPDVHHWMLGVVMVIVGYIMLRPHRRKY